MTEAGESRQSDGSRISKLFKGLLGLGKAGMRYKSAGRILAGIILAGLVAVPFAGRKSLLLAIIAAASVQLVWLIIDGAKEIAPPLRRRSWKVVAMIAVEYSAFIAIVCAALFFFIRALPGFVTSN